MNSLDQQLLELKIQKYKSVLFQELKSYVEVFEFKSETDLETSIETLNKEAVKVSILDFLNAEIEVIESGKNTPQSNGISTFTEEEITVLKNLANRALSKEKPASHKDPPKKSVSASGEDPIKFALKFRHLENKVIRYYQDEVFGEGKIVGINYPNLMVQLADQRVVSVNYQNITEK